MSSEAVDNNKFLQVLLAARRAKQLIIGDRKRIDIKADNPLTVAMEEIRQGKIDFVDILRAPLFLETPPEAEAAEADTAETTLADLLAPEAGEEAEKAEEEEKAE